MAAALLMVPATALVAQPASPPQTGFTPVVVDEVVPAQGRLLAEDGRAFQVTARTVLEMGPNTLHGPGALEALQPGVALRIVPEPDSDPPRIERMRVETR